MRVQTGGENITIVACVNASGTVILPPMIIYRGKSINQELTMDGIAGAMYASSPKSYIDTELFKMWMGRFVMLVPPARPILLLLDGHASRMNLQTVQFAKDNGIHMLCLPPHTTHLYQPLDVTMFRPLKTNFSIEAQKLSRKNKKKSLNRYDFNRVLKPAWQKSFTLSNIEAGFRKCGVWPYNPAAVTLPFSQGNTAGGTAKVGKFIY